ncbi:MAG TPA: transporter substrate-binding domain-containing protein, partial [Enterovirga sp.]
AQDGAKFQVLPDDLSYEPYGIMFARNDPAMAALVKRTFERLATSREIRWIYERWFVKRLPSGERLNIPVSEQLMGIWQMEGLPD